MTPAIVDALDLNRLAEFTRHAELLINLWTSAKLAAERGDAAVVRHNCKQAKLAADAAFALARALGSEDPET